mgnify:CR=1 FL=1
MPRTIVFGGAGFLGSHVVDMLLARGHEVVLFDRRRSAHDDNPQLHQVEQHGERELVEEVVEEERTLARQRVGEQGGQLERRSSGEELREPAVRARVLAGAEAPLRHVTVRYASLFS